MCRSCHKVGTSNREVSNTRECKLLVDTHKIEEEKWEKNQWGRNKCA